jgi:branched-chain amino acid transport system permease protein
MRRLVLALLAAAVVVLAAAPGAGAQPAGGGEGVRGAVRYEDESGERIDVEGASITVATADGQEVETVETGPDGTWEVTVPEPGRYTATLDPETLPDEVSLADEDRDTLTFDLTTQQVRTVLFRIQFGEGGGGGSEFFDKFARLAVEGLRYGLIIAICAIGLSLIFGTTGLVNFAHGEMVTFGALATYLFNVSWGINLLIAIPLAVLVGAVVGLGIDRGFWRPLHNRGTGLIAMMVTTIGLSILFRYVFLYQFGGFSETFDQYTLQTEGLEIGPVTIVPRDLIVMALSVVILVAVALFLQRTRMGRAMRAVADNRDLAESSGINVDKVVGWVWAAGAGLAALGGVFLGMSEQVRWDMGFTLLLLMFAATTLGGLGTAYGALVGSLAVGLFVQLSTIWVAPELKNVGALLLLALILLVRPQGILGQAERVG